MKDKKVLIIVLVVLLVCCLLSSVVGGVIWYKGKDAVDEIADELEDVADEIEKEIDKIDPIDTTDDDDDMDVTNKITPKSSEIMKTSSIFGFSVIQPKNWDFNETELSVQITSDIDGGEIDIEIYSDEALETLTSLDQSYCDSFGEGFREGLGDIESARSFYFKFFTLNGIQGCKSEGEIFEGVYQKYYVLFDKKSKDMYSMFYTTTDTTEKAALGRVMDSFEFLP